MAVPSSARIRIRFGSRLVTLNTAQVSAAATIAAASTPALAWASCSPWKASEATSRDTVTPMPAIVPAPTTDAQPAGGRILPRLAVVTSQAAPAVPIGLPATYPARMPSVSGEVNARARNAPLITSPALASANNGTIR